MAERESAAIELGIIELGETLSPQLQNKMAKVLAVRDDLAAQEVAQEAESSGFVTPVADTYSGLIEAGLPESAAAQVVAAVAPLIWRANRGAAHAPN
ncbi:hypothetical protein [Rhodococcus sp. MALMAid1271]|uniref:hypothetical protein n=1 Tax=Rhodococcus sp. MALMAid1271 TaxID=3411744 RepID=UPI003B9EABF9